MESILKPLVATGLSAICLLLSCSAKAQSDDSPGVTFDFTGANIGTVGNVTYGYEFQVTSPLAITALGIFNPIPGVGLTESHTVSLWNGSGTMIASTTVPAGLAGELVGNFLYAAIAPVNLKRGIYEIGAYYQDGNEMLVQNVSDLATAPGISIIEYQFAHPGYYDPALGQVITPGNGGAGFENMFGPGFLVSAVPEPSILSLLGLGAAALVFRRKSHGFTGGNRGHGERPWVLSSILRCLRCLFKVPGCPEQIRLKGAPRSRGWRGSRLKIPIGFIHVRD